jgi:hypothetical protein
MRRPAPVVLVVVAEILRCASNDIDDVIALIKAGKGSTACPRLGQPTQPAVPAQDDGGAANRVDDRRYTP